MRVKWALLELIARYADLTAWVALHIQCEQLMYVNLYTQGFSGCPYFTEPCIS